MGEGARRTLVLMVSICFVPDCSYSYMIDNVILLITGTLHERETSEVRLERNGMHYEKYNCWRSTEVLASGFSCSFA
jgi:uncharacterized sodium:solute symporter family permease YidK